MQQQQKSKAKQTKQTKQTNSMLLLELHSEQIRGLEPLSCACMCVYDTHYTLSTETIIMNVSIDDDHIAL